MKKERTYLYNFHNLLLIDSNVEVLPPQFLVTESPEDLETRLTIRVLDDFDLVNFKSYKELIRLGEHTFGEPNKHYIYQRRKFLNLNLKLFIEGLEDKHTKLVVSKDLYSGIRGPFPHIDLYRFIHYFKAVVVIKMALQGYAWIHSAALDYRKGGILLFGFPEAGKTSVLVQLILDREDMSALDDDVNLLGYDGTILSGGGPFEGIFFYAGPEYRYLKQRKSSFLLLTRLGLSHILSALSYIPFLPDFRDFVKKLRTVPVKIEGWKNTKRTKVRYVFFLESRARADVPPTCYEIDQSEAQRRILSICNREFYYLHSNLALLAYEYLNNSFSLLDVMKKYGEVIKKGLEKAEIYVLRAAKPQDFVKLISSII